MTIKLTEYEVATLIATLSTLICEEHLLTREQRENMIRTVATLGGLEERIRHELTVEDASRQKKTNKQREYYPDFPRTGVKWTEEDLNLIHSVIDDLPDEQIDNHIIWLSERQGRTPYAIALKVAGEGRLDKEWAKKWKQAAKDLREPSKDTK
ncbi:hypothetical protein [Kosakonia sacchari]|uniref:hypothetical protein n=1 Tax=Kosakonia sacchari TaxID=1158459 RepID=UPI001585B654|nr:hypothetical protein [Kosakonia sacchari]NUL39714.1 hypothetical protein [Kosakonia sacchari]